MMTVKRALVNYYKRLKDCSSSYKLDAELLVSYVLKRDRKWLFLNWDFELTKSDMEKIDQLVGLRRKGIPIAYLTGRKEFYKYCFYVNSHVLIPRPETETLLELVFDFRKALKKDAAGKNLFVDVGLGSGCVLISLIKELSFKGNDFLGIEKSQKALTVAQANLEKFKLDYVLGTSKLGESNLILIKSSLLNDLIDFDFKDYGNLYLVINLPYVSRVEYKNLDKEVLCEPKEALVASNQGLALIIKAIDQILEIKNRNSNLKLVAFFEIGIKHKPLLKNYLIGKKGNGKFKFSFKRDLSLRDRFLILDLFW
ncbi:MAG: HemK family protein methyltransferase [Candidatus Moranbacteria bacterium]|nr:HemK family protein methyltransferase [Candidatus Moranbacteria bacterium]